VKRFAYVALAAILYGATLLAAYAFFAAPGPSSRAWLAQVAGAGIVGCAAFTAAALRALRRQTVDDRPLMVWIWLSGGLGGLLGDAEHRTATRLVVGILLLVTGLVSLVQWIRNPKPPGPDSDTRTPAPPPGEVESTLDSSPSLGGPFFLGFALIVIAPVSQFYLRERSLAAFWVLAGLGLGFMLWGSLPRPGKRS
jgi:hypothetical protein